MGPYLTLTALARLTPPPPSSPSAPPPPSTPPSLPTPRPAPLLSPNSIPLTPPPPPRTSSEGYPSTRKNIKKNTNTLPSRYSTWSPSSGYTTTPRTPTSPTEATSNGYHVVVPYEDAPPSSDVTTSALPPTLAYLQQLSLSMVTDTEKPLTSSASSSWMLHVHHHPSRASWRLVRSLAEVTALQHRLADSLQLGHGCRAECRWLHGFVVSSLPRASLLARLWGPSSTAEERRHALLRLVSTLRTVLLNPRNHGCGILTGPVATQLVAFLSGKDAMRPRERHPWELRSPIGEDAGDFGALARRESDVHVDGDDEAAAAVGGVMEDANDGDNQADNYAPTSTRHVVEKTLGCMMGVVRGHPPVDGALAGWSYPTTALPRTRSGHASLMSRSTSMSVSVSLSPRQHAPSMELVVTPTTPPTESVGPRSPPWASRPRGGLGRRFTFPTGTLESLPRKSLGVLQMLRQRMAPRARAESTVC